VGLTHERPNVYYELGYAHGIGNASADVLLVAKAGSVLHFDIGLLRVRFYSTVQELEQIVRTCLGKMVTATRSPADPNLDNRIPDKRNEFDSSQQTVQSDSYFEEPHQPRSKELRRLEVRATDELYDAIKSIADVQGKSFGDVLSRALALYVRAHIKSREEFLLGLLSVNENNEVKVEEIFEL
jgi:hypothetical protein